RAWADGCSSAPVPYVEGWYVREDLRRTGVGRALIAAVERWARSAGFTEIGSDAQLDNTVSLRAHRRLGFRPTERLQFFCKSLAGPMAEAVRVEWYAGSRARLRPLFALAEDSPARLDSYLDAGRVLVATSGDEVLGHLQLVATGHPGEAEITNMAVREDHQGTGIGGGLLTTAIAALTDEGGSTLWVGTASADIDNLRFYQRHGFRMRSVERDAFTIATGYPPPAGHQRGHRGWLGGLGHSGIRPSGQTDHNRDREQPSSLTRRPYQRQSANPRGRWYDHLASADCFHRLRSADSASNKNKGPSQSAFGAACGWSAGRFTGSAATDPVSVCIKSSPAGGAVVSQGTWLPWPASKAARTQPWSPVETLRRKVHVPPSPGLKHRYWAS